MTILRNPDSRQNNGVTLPHAEVVSLLPRLSDGEVLDLGCGTGRHALYLNRQGIPITGWDNDPEALHALQSVIDNESLNGLTLEQRDLNQTRFNGQFQAILAIDTLMYLAPYTISQLIADMQAATSKHGYNLIVCAMSTDDMPSPLDFPFTFASGELSHYYRRWHIVHYNEHIRPWSAPNSCAEPVMLRFATLLAQKASVKSL
ncbi:methyltransferase domain-containing protein [Rosenbergiella australiborealis]|uniref:methyltransferase domain-containing protein n=1 Tax=Rosenbergiella australiborealis TaxID=1544696 RepID=UPI001F4EEFC8|nr:methyltransferase domain-containing protein [Rosenbergiella australiborealis]